MFAFKALDVEQLASSDSHSLSVYPDHSNSGEKSISPCEVVHSISDEESVSSETVHDSISDEESVYGESEVDPSSDEEVFRSISEEGEVDEVSCHSSPVQAAFNEVAEPEESITIDDLATITSRDTLSEAQKYDILTVKSKELKVYPMNSQKRRYRHKWSDTYEWIRYSNSSDGIFCSSCFLFSNVHFNGGFVSSPFRDWKNAVGKTRGALRRHSMSACHRQCIQQAAALIAVVEKKSPSIKSRLVTSYDLQVERNTKALVSIIDTLQYTIKQGIAQRGHSWNKTTRRENGNFSMLIDLIATYSPCLSDHLVKAARNARYLSPKIQNDFISINGDLIRQRVVEECNRSLFWSVMADEATDVSTVEQVSICVRYVSVKNEQLEVCEEFVGFTSVPRTTADVLTTAIDTFLKKSGLDLSKLIGKGFDGASNMSGHVSGVSTRLQQLYPKAKYYTHCRNHALNLVIVASCKAVTDIRRFMETLKELTLFFGNSAKRKHILLKHMSVQDQENLLADSMEDEDEEIMLIPKRRHRGIPVLSDTRWLSRVDSIDCMLQNYLPVCKAVEEIKQSSSGQSESDADSFLCRLMTFEFVASGVICHHLLAYTRPLTVALQEKECDLYKAHSMAQRLVQSLKSERKDDKFQNLWSRIKRIAATLNMEPAKKRTVSRQINRANPPVENIEAHYRVAYFYAFIDHSITHLQTRFPSDLQNALLATYFIPAKLCLLNNEIVVKLKNEFHEVLPRPSELEKEVTTWKVHMAHEHSKCLVYTCSVAEEHKRFYPNIHAMVMLLLSLPVGTCSCERSFSSLRRLKTWSRNAMSNGRLDSLAIGYINHAWTPSPSKVLSVWDKSGNRRIAVAFTSDDDRNDHL